MITLVFRLDYKCTWDGSMEHVFIIDGTRVTVEEDVRICAKRYRCIGW